MKIDAGLIGLDGEFFVVDEDGEPVGIPIDKPAGQFFNADCALVAPTLPGPYREIR